MDTVTITLIAMYFLSLIILSIAFISEWELIKTREQTEQALMIIILPPLTIMVMWIFLSMTLCKFVASSYNKHKLKLEEKRNNTPFYLFMNERRTKHRK